MPILQRAQLAGGAVEGAAAAAAAAPRRPTELGTGTGAASAGGTCQASGCALLLHVLHLGGKSLPGRIHSVEQFACRGGWGRATAGYLSSKGSTTGLHA